MPKDMLGIAVRKLVTLQPGVLGVVCDLLEKLSDKDWVIATKRFLRRENPWPEEAKKAVTSAPVERWRKLSDTAIEVNLDSPPTCPSSTVPEWRRPWVRGWVKVEWVGEEILVGGRKVILHLEPEQLEGILKGHTLRERLKTKDTLDPRIFEALVEFEDGRHISDSWKQDSQGRTLYLYAWAIGFRHRLGSLYVRYLCCRDGQWQCDFRWLDSDWDVQRPALILAS